MPRAREPSRRTALFPMSSSARGPPWSGVVGADLSGYFPDDLSSRRPPHDQGQNALLEQIWNTLLRSVLPASHTLAGWKFGTLPSAELFPGIGTDNPSNGRKIFT